LKDTEDCSGQFRLERTEAHIHVEFKKPHRVLSSAVLEGGLVEASHIVNLHVPKNSALSEGSEPPWATLENYCCSMRWRGIAVGMMTAASIDSFRKAHRIEKGVEVASLVTAGVSNARRAGDPADCRDIAHSPPQPGTINIIVLTNALLTPAAMVEAVQIATEAKSAALQDLNIQSPVTGGLATGTGTDAVAVAGGFGPVEIRYCGKHMLFGEMLAETIIEAVTRSLRRGGDVPDLHR